MYDDEDNGIEGEELHVLSLAEKEEDQESALVAKKVKHLPQKAQMQLPATLIDSRAIAWCSEDLETTDVLVRHSFRLNETEP